MSITTPTITAIKPMLRLTRLPLSPGRVGGLAFRIGVLISALGATGADEPEAACRRANSPSIVGSIGEAPVALRRYGCAGTMYFRLYSCVEPPPVYRLLYIVHFVSPGGW